MMRDRHRTSYLAIYSSPPLHQRFVRRDTRKIWEEQPLATLHICHVVCFTVLESEASTPRVG